MECCLKTISNRQVGDRANVNVSLLQEIDQSLSADLGVK
jgi:hypothetical protein